MRRILHVTASFFIVAVVYWAYAATIVPLVEPARRSADETGGARVPDELAAPESKYAALFEWLFPADHWTRNSRPKAIEVGQGEGMFVFQEYKTLENGRVEISPCVMMYFPTPWSRSSAPPPRDVIILEAPHKAVAQLDGPFEPAEWKIGDQEKVRLENIWLTGPVFIRSDMEEEGPEDDLEITTQDVLLNDRGIWSDAAVALRLGPHTGAGEKLDIRFLPSHKGRTAKEFNIGGVQSVQLLQKVRLVLQPEGQVGEGPPGPPRDFPLAGNLRQQIELTCEGPLFVNIPAQTAEFDHNVEVFVHGNGPSDSMTCESLKVVFAARRQSAPATVVKASPVARFERLPPRNDSPVANTSRDQTERHAPFEPVLFEATGLPVTINSPGRQLVAQCRRLVYDLRRSHLTLESLSPEELSRRRSSPPEQNGQTLVLHQHELCQIAFGAHRLGAPRLEYTLDQERPRQTLGTLQVAGPGWFTSVAEQEQRQQEVRATWQDSLQLIRQDGAPVLSLFGRPQFEVQGVVRLAANDLHVWLKEGTPSASSEATGSDGGSPPTGLSPDRLLARQDVEIDSPQITARVGQFEAWLVSTPATKRTPGLPGGPDLPLGRGEAAPWQTAASDRNAPGRSYYVEADYLQLRATLPDRSDRRQPSAELTHLTLSGSVLFEERTDPRQPSDSPARVQGDWINVAEAHTRAMMLRAKGRPVVATAGGTTLRGGEISFDQANGRFDVLTPGDLAVAIDRDHEGRPIHPPVPLNIAWQGTLTFDGRQAVLTDGVHVHTPHEHLQTARLVATLATPVPLETLEWNEQMDFDRLDCVGGVVVDRQTFDAGGLASQEHAEIPNLTIERGKGEIHASGPGWLRSVQLEREASPRDGSLAAGRPLALSALATQPSAGPQEDGAAAASRGNAHRGDPGLTYLRVDFQREMRGNLDSRSITFDGQVHCVRGPVTSWDQSLHVEQLSQLPENTVVLDAARLGIQQWIRDGKQWYGMEAQGGVEVEGGLRNNAIFTARGDRLTYDQSKDLMILDGGAGLASLVLEESLGGEKRQSCQAASVHFWPSRPEVLGNYVHSVEGEF